jgi:type II secretory pathway pseudopilin PulG
MKKGFTLLETLFAIFIITTGFFSVFSVVRVGIGATTTSINRLIAANLVQEGIEIIRNMRDSVYVCPIDNDWSVVVDNGHLNKNGCLVNPINCEVDIDSNKLLDEDDNTYLKINGDKYQYSSGQDSIFKRWVNLTRGGGSCSGIANSDDCIKVEVTVSWQEKGKNQVLQSEDYIYAWY